MNNNNFELHDYDFLWLIIIDYVDLNMFDEDITPPYQNTQWQKFHLNTTYNIKYVKCLKCHCKKLLSTNVKIVEFITNVSYIII